MPIRVSEEPAVVGDEPVVMQGSGTSLTTIVLVTLVSLIVIAIAVLLILHFTLGVA